MWGPSKVKKKYLETIVVHSHTVIMKFYLLEAK